MILSQPVEKINEEAKEKANKTCYILKNTTEPNGMIHMEIGNSFNSNWIEILTLQPAMIYIKI